MNKFDATKNENKVENFYHILINHIVGNGGVIKLDIYAPSATFTYKSYYKYPEQNLLKNGAKKFSADIEKVFF
jgi:hypothetical protein